jgi:hypothetical protein
MAALTQQFLYSLFSFLAFSFFLVKLLRHKKTGDARRGPRRRQLEKDEKAPVHSQLELYNKKTTTAEKAF